jgi:hypothetical protein
MRLMRLELQEHIRRAYMRFVPVCVFTTQRMRLMRLELLEAYLTSAPLPVYFAACAAVLVLSESEVQKVLSNPGPPRPPPLPPPLHTG